MLEIKGVVRMNVNIGTTKRNNVILYVVLDKIMRCQVIMGRDLMKDFEFKLMEPEGMKALDDTISEIMNIEINNSNIIDEIMDSLDIGSEITEHNKVVFRNIIKEKYVLPERPQEPMIKMKLKLKLCEHTPFHFSPRRLSFNEKTQLQEIIDRLLSKGVIRASESEYASPIVIVRKKNGEARLCVDYRVLNKYIIRDNYPLPLLLKIILLHYMERNIIRN